jgi:hypothetical protein
VGSFLASSAGAFFLVGVCATGYGASFDSAFITRLLFPPGVVAVAATLLTDVPKCFLAPL